MNSTHGVVHDSSKLRKLISENPDLPIVVLAGDDASNEDYAWTYCSLVNCSIGDILDIKTPYDRDGYVFADKYEFEDAIINSIPYDDPRTDEEVDAFVKSELVKYEPYWREVIAIYASN